MEAPGFMVTGSVRATKKRVCIPYRHAERVRPYVAAMEAARVDVLACPVDQAVSLEGMDGLLLTGGTDINPKLYGQAANEYVDVPDDQRDEVEWQLLESALVRDLPVLAICRGMQLLNVQRGGTLLQHLGLPRHDTEFADKSTVAHEVALQPGSRLAEIVGAERLSVNSRHHQAVDRLGARLALAAWDVQDPAIVEGYEDPSRRFLVGVQWHPEDQAPGHAQHRRLFEAFAASL